MPDSVTTDRPMDRPNGREPGSRPLLRTILGQVLRRTRREQGRTLAEVARAARVSMPYLSELERGRKEASSEVLAAICDALKIQLADLLTQVGRGLAASPTSGPPRQASRPGSEVRASVDAAVQARHGTVVRLDDFREARERKRGNVRSRRTRPARRVASPRRGPGEVVLLGGGGASQRGAGGESLRAA